MSIKINIVSVIIYSRRFSHELGTQPSEERIVVQNAKIFAFYWVLNCGLNPMRSSPSAIGNGVNPGRGANSGEKAAFPQRLRVFNTNGLAFWLVRCYSRKVATGS
jgi:hypothetical protein